MDLERWRLRLSLLDLLGRTAIGILRGDKTARRFVEIVAALLA
jgi:hypothetical protein